MLHPAKLLFQITAYANILQILTLQNYSTIRLFHTEMNNSRLLVSCIYRLVSYTISSLISIIYPIYLDNPYINLYHSDVLCYVQKHV